MNCLTCTSMDYRYLLKNTCPCNVRYYDDGSSNICKACNNSCYTCKNSSKFACLTC